jgi:hypothetical protein
VKGDRGSPDEVRYDGAKKVRTRHTRLRGKYQTRENQCWMLGLAIRQSTHSDRLGA